MKRWVLAGGLLLVAVAAFLLLQLRTPADASTPIAEVARRELPPLPEFPVGRNQAPESVMAEEDEPHAAPTDGPPQKLDPKSDEFFRRFDEVIARKLTAEAATCYNGGKERDQKVKFGFRAVIRDGRVTIRDVKQMVSTLNDPALERCMLEKVAGFASWKDDAFPDYEMDDEVLIRVRALKKHKQEEDRAYFPPTPVVNAE